VSFGIVNSFFANDKTSKTTFIPRSLLTDSAYEQCLNNYWFTAHKKERSVQHSKNPSTLMAQSVYAVSENYEDLASYFLLNNKTSLKVKESSDGDISSRWLRITGADDISSTSLAENPFNSEFTIHPKRSIYGIIFGIHGNLDRILTGMFCEVKAPLLEVRHTLDFDEFGKKALSTNEDHRTVLDALNSHLWHYGKFNPKKMVADGVDDILFRLGYNYVDKNKLHGTIYGDVIFPLGEGTKAEFVFEPMVGSVHAGLGVGSSINWKFYSTNEQEFSLIGDARYHYRFEGKEVRSFDLQANGPWSRYLLLTRNAGIRPLSAINLFTRDVDVLPRGSFEFSGIFHYQYFNFHLEVGYNLWARSSESVELHDHWDKLEENVGIYYSADPDTTASTATISTPVNSAVNDGSFIQIQESDFNLKSAAHDSALSHKIFSGVSINSSVFDFPARIGLGSSYEFADSNTALKQWSVWFNTTIQY
jgi:hypothetical protein